MSIVITLSYYFLDDAVRCPTNSFLCNNNKCISEKMKCDDVDDCGDLSDEQEGCKSMFSHLYISIRTFRLIL